jgi:AraC-like DNA-binding protein
MTEAPRTGPFHTTLLDTGAAQIGAFRCHPEHPAFADSGPARSCCFVFPRTAVAIQHEHERAFVANPNVVTFYNRGQEYRRGVISPDGDRCDWFALDPEIVRDMSRTFDPSVDDRPERPFQFTRGVSDERTYLMQRRLFESVSGHREIDPLAVEERVIELLDRVMRSTYGHRGTARLPDPAAIAHAEWLLSANWDRPLRLRDIARDAGLSMYHLCRTFREATGRTLHQYRAGLRLRRSMEAVRESNRGLVEVALDAGFSSHSHFSSAFRQAFGETPSQFRGRARF